jgi:hypothetical protein
MIITVSDTREQEKEKRTTHRTSDRDHYCSGMVVRRVIELSGCIQAGG